MRFYKKQTGFMYVCVLVRIDACVCVLVRVCRRSCISNLYGNRKTKEKYLSVVYKKRA